MSPPVEQIAALPISWTKSGKIRVLMVTSRDTGRWVVPKGWKIAGQEPWQAAAIEALEEAGAEGQVFENSIGSYGYNKTLDNGKVIPCRVRVYPMVVERLKRRWKERDERIRRWFTPRAASRSVQEPELAELLITLRSASSVSDLSATAREG